MQNVCRCTEQTVTTSAPLITAPARFQSDPCTFNLVFENNEQILVVREDVGYASIIVKIEPSHPLCVWQKTVTFKVSCKSYSAIYDEDYQGRLYIN